VKIESIIVYPDKPKVTAVNEPPQTTVFLGTAMGDLVARFEVSEENTKIITLILRKVQVC